MQSILRYVLPLLALIFLIQIDWVWHHHEGVASNEQGRRLLFWVGMVTYVAAVFMLAFTRRWTLQSLGLLALLFAGAELKVRLIDQAGPPVPEWERDYIHAAFQVGTAAIFVSLVIVAITESLQWWQNWRHPLSMKEWLIITALVVAIAVGLVYIAGHTSAF